MKGVAYSKLRPALPDWCPASLSTVVRLAWANDFTQRPAFTDILRVLSHTERLLEQAPSWADYRAADDAFASKLVATPVA